MDVGMRSVATLLIVLAMVPGESLAAPPAKTADEMTPVLASVLAAPVPVRQTDGLLKVVYELELTNVTDAPMTIQSVEVRAPQQGDALVRTLAAEDISGNLVLPGGVKTTTLGPGQSGLLFVNLTFKRRDDVPAALAHRLTVTTSDTRGKLPARSVETVAPTRVETTRAVVVGPPLRGGRWVAVASCCNSYHRRAALPINGRRWLAQRFAIDWMQVDEQHRIATGDPARNESYPQFGAPAIAVANARVVHVTDGLPEGNPGSFPSGVTVATADGNSVILDLGNGRYALYAHLQPGSIRVREGQWVRRGQTLGLVGNSGNSDAPHLHFHVMDGPSPLASNGLPYMIDAFDVLGQAMSGDDLESASKTPQQPIEISPVTGSLRRNRELPADLAVVAFPP